MKPVVIDISEDKLKERASLLAEEFKNAAAFPESFINVLDPSIGIADKAPIISSHMGFSQAGERLSLPQPYQDFWDQVGDGIQATAIGEMKAVTDFKFHKDTHVSLGPITDEDLAKFIYAVSPSFEAVVLLEECVRITEEALNKINALSDEALQQAKKDEEQRLSEEINKRQKDICHWSEGDDEQNFDSSSDHNSGPLAGRGFSDTFLEIATEETALFEAELKRIQSMSPEQWLDHEKEVVQRAHNYGLINKRAHEEMIRACDDFIGERLEAAP